MISCDLYVQPTPFALLASAVWQSPKAVYEALFAAGILSTRPRRAGVCAAVLSRHAALDVTVSSAPWRSVVSRTELHARLLAHTSTAADGDSVYSDTEAGRMAAEDFEEVLRSRQLLLSLVQYANGRAESSDGLHHRRLHTLPGAAATGDASEQAAGPVAPQVGRVQPAQCVCMYACVCVHVCACTCHGAHFHAPQVPADVRFAFDTTVRLTLSHLRLLARLDAAGAVDLVDSTLMSLLNTMPGAMWPTPAPQRRLRTPTAGAPSLSAVPRALAAEFIALLRQELVKLSAHESTELAEVRFQRAFELAGLRGRVAVAHAACCGVQVSVAAVVALDVRRGELGGILSACRLLLQDQCRDYIIAPIGEHGALPHRLGLDAEGQLLCPAAEPFSSSLRQTTSVASPQPPTPAAPVAVLPVSGEPSFDADGLAAAVADFVAAAGDGDASPPARPASAAQPASPGSPSRLLTSSELAVERLTADALAATVEAAMQHVESSSPYPPHGRGSAPGQVPQAGCEMRLHIPTVVDVGDAFHVGFHNSGSHPIPANSDFDKLVLVRLRDGAVDSRWQVCLLGLRTALSMREGGSAMWELILLPVGSWPTDCPPDASRHCVGDEVWPGVGARAWSPEHRRVPGRLRAQRRGAVPQQHHARHHAHVPLRCL